MCTVAAIHAPECCGHTCATLYAGAGLNGPRGVIHLTGLYYTVLQLVDYFLLPGGVLACSGC